MKREYPYLGPQMPRCVDTQKQNNFNIMANYARHNAMHDNSFNLIPRSTMTTANLDSTQGIKQLYGNMSYPFWDNKTFGPVDENQDKRRVHGSAFMPYTLPDPSQYPYPQLDRMWMKRDSRNKMQNYNKTDVENVARIQATKQNSQKYSKF